MKRWEGWEVGKSYKTVGGWKAKIIWSSKNTCCSFKYLIAIHFKDDASLSILTERENICFHYNNGEAFSPNCTFEIPRFGINFPADLTEEEWIE